MVTRDNLWESALSLYYVGPRDQTQLLSAGCLSHLVSPFPTFVKRHFSIKVRSQQISEHSMEVFSMHPTAIQLPSDNPAHAQILQPSPPLHWWALAVDIYNSV